MKLVRNIWRRSSAAFIFIYKGNWYNKFMEKKHIIQSEKLIVNFENIPVRRVWDKEKEQWFFAIIDIVAILTESPRPRKYWNALKTKLKQEGSELSQKLGQLKMKAEDGKMRITA